MEMRKRREERVKESTRTEDRKFLTHPSIHSWIGNELKQPKHNSEESLSQEMMATHIRKRKNEIDRRRHMLRSMRQKFKSFLFSFKNFGRVMIFVVV